MVLVQHFSKALQNQFPFSSISFFLKRYSIFFSTSSVFSGCPSRLVELCRRLPWRPGAGRMWQLDRRSSSSKQTSHSFLNQQILRRYHGQMNTWGRILGRNPDKSLESFFSLLLTALPSDYFFFKLAQPFTVSRVQLPVPLHCKGKRKKTW